MASPTRMLVAVSAAATLGLGSTTASPHSTFRRAWGLAVPVAEVNTSAAEGCPIESPDGLSLYIASNRAGSLGNPNDIWASDRASTEEPWGEPKNLGAPVNSEAADFCPTPIDGSWLLFVSERSGPETCDAGPGSGDMYLIRRNAAFGWGEPRHLGCVERGDGPNSNGGEFSPSLVKTAGGTFLFFSSTAGGDMDIYVSRLGHDGRFGPPSPVSELNTEHDDRMPNVSADGLEIVFSSNRLVDAYGQESFGGQDVYRSTRHSIFQRWSPPANVGRNVNTPGSETRATMSGDRERLYFGRDGDIFMSKRQPLR